MDYYLKFKPQNNTNDDSLNFLPIKFNWTVSLNAKLSFCLVLTKSDDNKTN